MEPRVDADDLFRCPAWRFVSFHLVYEDGRVLAVVHNDCTDPTVRVYPATASGERVMTVTFTNR